MIERLRVLIIASDAETDRNDRKGDRVTIWASSQVEMVCDRDVMTVSEMYIL